MKLQACHQCGAQFDVSQFAPGQKFTCGSCGAVLTAHVAPAAHKAPAARPSRPEPRGPARAAPSRQAAQPKRRAAAAAGGGRRGPQYRPPERHQEAKTARRPAKPKAAARSARPAARSRGEARAKKGVNPALIYGAGGLLVAAVLLFLVFANSGKKADDTAATNPGATTVADTHPGNGATGTTPSGTGTPEKADTLASLQAEVAKADLRDASDYTSLAKRFLALGTDEAKEEARSLYETLIKQVAPNNAEARAFLGYTDFQKDILGKVVDNGDPIPEAINNRRGYPFLDAVVKFNERRWLDDDDEIQLAREAVAKMREHQKRLETDRAYHLGDIVRANIALDPMLGDLNYEMYWKAPYLVVYSTSEALSDFDLLDKTKYPDKKAREKAKAALAEKRKGWSSVLKEKAAIFQSVYKEFMRRFGEKFDLKPLDAPWGGRPDYEGGDRRFEYGVPMVIWIFNNADEFHKYHEKRLGQKLPPASPATSRRRPGGSSSTTRAAPATTASSRSTRRSTKGRTSSSTGSRARRTSGGTRSPPRTPSPRASRSTSVPSRCRRATGASSSSR